VPNALATEVEPSTGRPLSFDDRSEFEAVRTLIHLHAPECTNPKIFDATWGAGRIWAGQEFEPEARLDQRRLPGVTHLGSFTNLLRLTLVSGNVELAAPGGYYHVVAFDPPHMCEAGETSKHYERFATVNDNANITHLYRPFLEQAKRLLVPNGIVLVKVENNAHRGRMQWQAFDFPASVRQVPGLVACDYKIVPATRASTLTGANWGNVRHCRRNDVVWFVVRKGGCMRPEQLACPHRPEWRRGHVDD
jgi:hypothetical protein